MSLQSRLAHLLNTRLVAAQFTLQPGHVVWVSGSYATYLAVVIDAGDGEADGFGDFWVQVCAPTYDRSGNPVLDLPLWLPVRMLTLETNEAMVRALLARHIEMVRALLARHIEAEARELVEVAA